MEKAQFLLVQNIFRSPISINSFIQWYRFLFKLSIFVTVDFQRPNLIILIKSCLPFTSISLISFIKVFAPFLCCHGLWSLFERCLFLFVFRCCCCLFSLWFSFLVKISSSKEVVVSIAVVELIIRTITFTIVYYIGELPFPINFYRAVVNSTLKNFSQWSWLRLEMRLCKLFGQSH